MVHARSRPGWPSCEGNVLDFHQNLAEQVIAEVQSWNESSGPDLDEIRPLASTVVLSQMLARLLAATAAERADGESRSCCSFSDDIPGPPEILARRRASCRLLPPDTPYLRPLVLGEACSLSSSLATSLPR